MHFNLAAFDNKSSGSAKLADNNVPAAACSEKSEFHKIMGKTL
jgi:hypothetical protein